MPTIAAVLIVKNEADVVARCLRSLAWVDELVVVDDESTDETVAIAESFGARVFKRRLDRFDTQHNFATDQSTCEWVLSIDADEEVPASLADEIRTTIVRPDARDVYGIPFLQQIFGRWVLHGSWADPLYRLYRRRVRWHGAVHERVGDGEPRGLLTQPMLHYSHRTVGDFLAKLNRYTDFEAQARLAEGQRFSALKTLLSPLRDFWRRYVVQRGWRDGAVGLVLAGLMAVYVFVVRIKVWELSRTADDRPPLEHFAP
jgi:(heptosyl)LPS beta-1,4-glucosyltransferase